jgi:hypothetical protein
MTKWLCAYRPPLERRQDIAQALGLLDQRFDLAQPTLGGATDLLDHRYAELLAVNEVWKGHGPHYDARGSCL